MAINRYDQRKNYEEAEANAIGTEYVRADLLPADAAAKIRALLTTYTDERILFYTTRDPSELQRVNVHVAQLQNQLWAAVVPAAEAQPTPVVALAVAGMNDVLNSQGYTQAAWWNRIPIAAWCSAGCHRHLLQRAGRLRFAPRQRIRHPDSDSAGDCLYFLLAHCRYRQPARRHDSCEAAEPSAPLPIHSINPRRPGPLVELSRRARQRGCGWGWRPRSAGLHRCFSQPPRTPDSAELRSDLE